MDQRCSGGNVFRNAAISVDRGIHCRNGLSVYDLKF